MSDIEESPQAARPPDDPTLAEKVQRLIRRLLLPRRRGPFKNAAATGNIHAVKLLLEHGADPNRPEPGIAPRGHALYSAVYNRHYDVAKLLLEHGAYPNVQSKAPPIH